MRKSIREATLNEWIAQEHPDVDADSICDTIADWLEANSAGRDPDGNHWSNIDGEDAFDLLAGHLTANSNKSFKERNRG